MASVQISIKPKTTFSPEDVKVIFVLGGPGSGKGTQCKKIIKDYDFCHLSAGDLLRAERQREGSRYGQMIHDTIEKGGIVPKEVTVELLKTAMKKEVEDKHGKGLFLIDGFPRQMDQALFFEETVVLSQFTLFFDCPEDELERRLLERGKESNRVDDNPDSIKLRFKTFVETSMPVVKHYEQEGKVENISAVPGPEEVYRHVKERMEKRGISIESNT